MTTRSKMLAFVAVLGCAALAYGASSHVKATAEADAVLYDAEGDPTVAGFALRRGWVWVAGKSPDSNSVAELVQALNAVTVYTNPLANGHTYSGVFVNSKVAASDENVAGMSDRGAAIIQTLTKVNVLTNGSVASLGTPYKLADQTVLSFMGYTEGTNSRVYHKYDNLNPADRSIAMSLDPTESGFRISQKEFRVQENNVGVFLVTFETNVFDNVSDGQMANTNVYAQANPSGFVRSKQTGSDGMSVEQIDTARGAVTADSGWFLDGVNVREGGNGEFGLRVTQTKERTLGEPVIVSWRAAVANREEAQGVVWYMLSGASATNLYQDAQNNATNMSAATYQPAPAGHYLYDITIEPQDNGAYVARRVTFKPSATYRIWPESTADNTIYYDDIKTRTVLGVDQARKFTYKKEVTACATWTEAASQFGTNAYVRGSGIRGGVGHYFAVEITLEADTGWIDAAQVVPWP